MGPPTLCDGNAAPSFAGRLGILQRLLKPYRVAFFDAVAQRTANGVSIFAGYDAHSGSAQGVAPCRRATLYEAHNLQFFSGKALVYWQSNAIKWLEHLDPAVVIAEANPRLLSTRLVTSWMHRRNRPVLGWGMGTTQLTPGFATVRRVARCAFMRQFDHMIAYSSRAAEQYAAIGFDPNAITVAPNAVSLAAEASIRRAAERAGALAILFVGQLTREKRVDNLIRAAAQVGSRTSVTLTVVGDGPARERLRLQAESELPSTRFVGEVRGAALGEYWRAADVFVLPGLGGLATQEAMAHGLPVISAEADGTQADLVRSSNGWLVPPNDVNALASALSEAASDRDRLRTMGEASYSIVKNEANLFVMRDALLQAVNQASTASPRGGVSRWRLCRKV